jgi:tRNA threonylcarbamoyl adenosine modification protein YeaZ
VNSLNAIIIHGGYSHVELGIVKNALLIDTHPVHKHQVSRDILIALDLLLSRNNLTLSACACIIAHQGPGPFTTLRVTLATVNGLGFATGLPLVGVDGLNAFVEEQKHAIKTRFFVVILNAFCDDVYYAIYDTKTGTLSKGCQSITAFITHLKSLISDSEKTATIMGNGLMLHKEILQHECGNSLIIPENYPELCSISAAAQQGMLLWYEKKYDKQLVPLYLKDSSAHLKSMIS